MPSPLIQVRHLNHTYGEGSLRRQILFDICCDIYPGEIFIVSGPSGSGKSTFLTLIGALRTVQDGSILLQGTELREAGPRQLVEVRRRIGFVFQQHHLLPALSARENVQMPLAPGSTVTRREAGERASLLLRAVGLSDHADKRPAQLSGGQRQRVAIARALARRPSIILADEPTASLDSSTGRDIVQLLQQLARQESCAVIIVTHDSRILDVADRIAHLEDGRLEESDLRLERIQNATAGLARQVSEFLAAVRPENATPPPLAQRLITFAETATNAQTLLATMTESHRQVIAGWQRTAGELVSLGDAVAGVATWFEGCTTTTPAMPVFEAIEGLLLVFADAVSSGNPEELATVEEMAQSGGKVLERLLRSDLGGPERTELIGRVAPIPFLIGSIAGRFPGGEADPEE